MVSTALQMVQNAFFASDLQAPYWKNAHNVLTITVTIKVHVHHPNKLSMPDRLMTIFPGCDVVNAPNHHSVIVPTLHGKTL
jgi:hypothetical protein